MSLRFPSLVVFLAAVVPVILLAGDDNVTFKSDVALVRVDAQVLDSGNRAITHLTAADFVLRENGKPTEIRNFLSEDMPLDVLFLLDVSASMKPHVQRISDAAHEAFRALGEQDRIGIMVFDRSTRVRLPFSSNRSEAEQAMQMLLHKEGFNGGTDITLGMQQAANYISRNGRREARRAIVILTDDQTEFERDEAGVERSLASADSVMSALIAPDAMGSMYPGGGGGNYPPGGQYPRNGRRGNGGLGGIILGQPRYPGGGGGGYPGGGGGSRYPGGGGMGHSRTHSAGTSEIARESGGDSMSVDEAQALETTLERLRQRYALHFYQSGDIRQGETRRVELQLADGARRRYPDAEIRYRKSYSSGGGSDAVQVSRAGDARRAGDAPGVETVRAGSRNADGSTDAERPVVRRRPAVDDSGTGPRPAILQPGPQSGDSVRPAGGWRRSDDVAPDTQTPAAPADAQAQKKPGWRKANPDDK